MNSCNGAFDRLKFASPWQWQFAPTPSPTFDSRESVVGPPAFARTVFYMCRRSGESALSIGSTVLSNDSNLDRQFASIAPGAFDSQGSVVEPQGLAEMVFYISGTLAESAFLIG
jgi:hypothetical protein